MITAGSAAAIAVSAQVGYLLAGTRRAGVPRNALTSTLSWRELARAETRRFGLTPDPVLATVNA